MRDERLMIIALKRVLQGQACDFPVPGAGPAGRIGFVVDTRTVTYAFTPAIAAHATARALFRRGLCQHDEAVFGVEIALCPCNSAYLGEERTPLHDLRARTTDDHLRLLRRAFAAPMRARQRRSRR